MKERAKIHCPVCETDQWQRTTGEAYNHDGVTSPISRCPGSGLDRLGMLRTMRRFDSRDNTQHVQRATEIRDNAESILLTTTLRVDGHVVAEVETDIAPQDTLRLIKQLTSIAQARGLLQPHTPAPHNPQGTR